MKSLLYFLSSLPLTVSFCVKENNFLNCKNEAKTTLCCSLEEDNNLLDYSNVKEKENKNVYYNFLFQL
ncbi:MAG: hypothetical protein IJ656_01960 [Bacilli bacterium]|nr:hypothetical protein [Bacilli bacterium]